MKRCNHHALCETPPMGWNSWDCYGAAVSEETVRKNAEYMAKKLKKYGWEYVVVDIEWFEPTAKSHVYNDYAHLCFDEYSRLVPAENRFPSSAGGRGFRPLSDYVHSLGLKFGIHILRGIPRECVKENTLLKYGGHALDIADVDSVCEWNRDMYGVDPTKAGADKYYESLFEMYAEWGVDFVKVDDIARPYHKGEVELIRKAIDKCGRDMVLSLSPGAAALSEAEHLVSNANMWRMTDDFWDNWTQLYDMFERCRNWQNLRLPGAWPDCDMLPLGTLAVCDGGRKSNFTYDEQKTMMALWSIFRSPLMFGGDMTMNDGRTESFMTNEALTELLKHSKDNRELCRDERGAIIWTAKSEDDTLTYIAHFNTSEHDLLISTPLSLVGLENVSATELFDGKEYEFSDFVTSLVVKHGVKIYKLRKF